MPIFAIVLVKASPVISKHIIFFLLFYVAQAHVKLMVDLVRMCYELGQSSFLCYEFKEYIGFVLVSIVPLSGGKSILIYRHNSLKLCVVHVFFLCDNYWKCDYTLLAVVGI